MTQPDLFEKKSKCEQFWEFCQLKELFSSIDISRYANANYYLRAGRTARSWAELEIKTGVKPRLRRLLLEEKLFKGLVKKGNANICWYAICDKIEEVEK